MDELEAAAMVLARAVDSDSNEKVELEDGRGAVAGPSPASDVLEVTYRNNIGLPAPRDHEAAEEKVLARPFPPRSTRCPLSQTC